MTHQELLESARRPDPVTGMTENATRVYAQAYEWGVYSRTGKAPVAPWHVDVVRKEAA
jgi:hypothetical protein